MKLCNSQFETIMLTDNVKVYISPFKGLQPLEALCAVIGRSAVVGLVELWNWAANSCRDQLTVCLRHASLYHGPKFSDHFLRLRYESMASTLGFNIF